MEKTSFLSDLWERRVPHTIGLYIAATWMSIEIGDWVIERFLLAPEITSYIFIAMLSFLPSVILLAYQYGKKGKDPWHKSTFAIVPFNLILAAAIPTILVQPVKATEIKIAIDEKGATQEYVVPKQQYQKRLISFFWTGDGLNDEDQWLQYAAPWLLSKDLDRNEFISSITAFDHSHLFDIINKAGFKKGIGEPLALQLETVRNHSRELFLTGNVDKKDNGYLLKVNLYNTKDGQIQETFSAENKDLFKAIDAISAEITQQLIGFASREQINNDLPVNEHAIAKPDALKIAAQAMLGNLEAPFNIEYIKQLETAHSIDETSLEIQKLLSSAYLYAGKVSLAKKFGEMAIAQSYKLTREEKFKYQGYLYSLNSDTDSHLKILSLWVELYPNSVEAHNYLAKYQQSYAADLKIAEESLLKVISLLPNDMGAYYRLSKLYESMGDLDKAIDNMNKAIELSSDDVNGNLYLALLYEQKGLFDQATQIYEKITLIDPSNTSAKYFLALNNYKIGNFKEAKKIINALRKQSDLSLSLSFSLTYLINQIYITTGEIRNAQEQLNKFDNETKDLPAATKLAASIIPQIDLLSKLGKSSEQAAEIKRVMRELEPPFSYYLETQMLDVYQKTNDVDSIKEFINKYEALKEQEAEGLIETMLRFAYLSLYETTEDYTKARETASKITEDAMKTADDIMKRFTFLSWKVKLARFYRLTEFNKESETLLQEVLNEFPASVLAKKELVELYIKTDRLDDAKQLDVEIMKTWANSDEDYVVYKNYLQLREKLNSLI
ncbi:MAG: tetratricopeptide repeat protein [Gammaproteobacteria bacterium]|nr:tetratricopeptide repeat protein [Gammaproteobacteria bacterium]